MTGLLHVSHMKTTRLAPPTDVQNFSPCDTPLELGLWQANAEPTTCKINVYSYNYSRVTCRIMFVRKEIKEDIYFCGFLQPHCCSMLFT